MKLDTLDLLNFRNHDRRTLTFEDGFNIIIGRNGEGKTNILEAIYLVMRGQSPRTAAFKELIQWGNAHSRVRASLWSHGRKAELRTAIVTVAGGVRQKRQGNVEAAGMGAVVFDPDHLRIIKDEPERRRSFLDEVLCASEPGFTFVKKRYQKIVRQRNALLKRESCGKDLLCALDVALVDYGSKMIASRIALTRALNPLAGRVFKKMTGKTLTLEYDSPHILEPLARPALITEEYIRAAFKRAVASQKAREIDRGTSLVGPHRDDLLLRADAVDIRAFGSQGDQRTAALALKLAELEYFTARIQEPPVLLLDDVFSELDEARRQTLVDAVGERHQVLITTTEVPEFVVGAPTANIMEISTQRGQLYGTSEINAAFEGV